jgi:hypothetical protein
MCNLKQVAEIVIAVAGIEGEASAQNVECPAIISPLNCEPVGNQILCVPSERECSASHPLNICGDYHTCWLLLGVPVAPLGYFVKPMAIDDFHAVLGVLAEGRSRLPPDAIGVH